jgi:hypothetical protein
MPSNEIKTLKIIHHAMAKLDRSGMNETVTQAMTMIFVAMQHLRENIPLSADSLFKETIMYCTANRNLPIAGSII